MAHVEQEQRKAVDCRCRSCIGACSPVPDRVGGRASAAHFAIPSVSLTFSLGGLKVTVQVTEPEKPCYMRGFGAAFPRTTGPLPPGSARPAGRAHPGAAAVPSPSTCEKAVTAASAAATRAAPGAGPVVGRRRVRESSHMNRASADAVGSPFGSQGSR